MERFELHWSLVIEIRTLSIQFLSMSASRRQGFNSSMQGSRTLAVDPGLLTALYSTRAGTEPSPFGNDAGFPVEV